MLNSIRCSVFFSLVYYELLSIECVCVWVCASSSRETNVDFITFQMEEISWMAYYLNGYCCVKWSKVKQMSKAKQSYYPLTLTDLMKWIPWMRFFLFRANDKGNWVKRNTSKQIKKNETERTNQINGEKKCVFRAFPFISFEWKMSNSNGKVSKMRQCVRCFKGNESVHVSWWLNEKPL